MVKMREALCRNPDHEEVTGGQSRLYTHGVGPGQPRKYCSKPCTRWVNDHYRPDDLGQLIPKVREYMAGSYPAARRESAAWLTSGATKRVARIATEEQNPVLALSFDMTLGEGEDGRPFSLYDITADTATTRTDKVPLTTALPLDDFGYADYSLLLSYYPATDPVLGKGDGSRIQAQHRPTGLFVNWTYPDPFVVVLRDMLSRPEWRKRYHGYLNGLRQLWAEGFDGPETVLPVIVDGDA